MLLEPSICDSNNYIFLKKPDNDIGFLIEKRTLTNNAIVCLKLIVFKITADRIVLRLGFLRVISDHITQLSRLLLGQHRGVSGEQRF